MRQTTLARPFAFEGTGLHTGAPARVRVEPAPIDSGFVIQTGTVSFSATADAVVDTSRATVLGSGEATVSTVEHLLSALFGMGLSNARIVADGPEIPVADGSARSFVEAIDRAGVVEQGRERPCVRIAAPLHVGDADRLVVLLPSETFRVRFIADFEAPIGTQYTDVTVTPGTYRDDICGARTFGWLHEVEALRARGLAQGGSLDNAVVFTADGPMQPLRWPNEVVRHKVLDLLGDFALLGAWPLVEIVAIKSGHALHARAVHALRAAAAHLSAGAA